MSLVSELKTSGSPIKGYFAAHLGEIKELNAEWRHRLGRAESVPVPEIDGRPRASECGLAIGHLLAGLVTDSLGWGSGGTGPAEAIIGCPLTDEIDAALRAPVGSHSIEVAAALSWWAGLFDRQGRGFAERSDPFLAPLLRATTLDEAVSAAPGAAVADMVTIAENCRSLLAALPRPMQSGVCPSGAASVGGADADLAGSSWVVEIKSNGTASVGRSAAWQAIGYPLLDQRDRWRTSTIAILHARQARLVEWPFEQLIETLSGGLLDVATARRGLWEVLTHH